MKVVIVGGNALGASTAARLRRLDENVEITIIEKNDYVSFANCGLPYYLSGIIASSNSLFVTSKDELKRKYKLNLLDRTEMIGLDENKKVIFISSENGEEEITYDYLVLAMGSINNVPPIKIDEGVKYHTLHTVEDAIELKIMLVNKKKVAIVGAGFIGLELLDNVLDGKKEIHLFEATNRIASLDEDMSLFALNILKKRGVNVHLNSAIKDMSKEEDKILLHYDNENLEVDDVIMVTGVKPNIKPIEGSSIKLIANRFIDVDDHLRTNNPYIYAGGDLILSTQMISKAKIYAPLAGYANKDARIIANNIMGMEEKRSEVLRTSIFHLLGYAFGRVGLSEDECKKLNISYRCLYSLPFNHVTYYPGAKRLFQKVIFDDSGLILGATIIGEVDVPRKIDTLSAIMRKHGTYIDLMNLDLSYSPVYGSAKDGLNMIGFMFDNEVRLGQKNISPLDFYKKKDSLFILDVRAKSDFDNFHFDNAINIPFSELRERISELPNDKTIYVICYTGVSSYNSCRLLSNLGFDAINVQGGHTFLKVLNDIV